MTQNTPIDGASTCHFPGRVPATTALRVLLAHVGVRDPHTKKPFTEAMLFGIAGGVGVGVAAFHYAKENFSSFFIAGRHLWFDDLLYLKNALARFGIKPTVKESAGAKAAEKNLRDALEASPCIAWVDMTHLPHRGMPAQWSGMGYHVVTVYKIDGNNALIGDLAENPIAIPPTDLAAARARIAKDKNRLLSISNAPTAPDLETLIKDGLRACHAQLSAKPGKGPYAMSTLGSLQKWADRLHGSKDKESWETMFPPGSNLWRALTSIYQFIERYGTGGGLFRPLMAEFLAEAGKALKDARLKKLSETYADLGRSWRDLANAALPDDVALLKAAREQYDKLALCCGSEEKKAVWARLGELAAKAKVKFPLDAAQCAELRADLKKRVEALVADEIAALAAMSELI
jgi:hypothetical protein